MTVEFRSNTIDSPDAGGSKPEISLETTSLETSGDASTAMPDGRFYLQSTKHLAYLCDPKVPLTHGCMVAAYVVERSVHFGTVKTKHPLKANIIAVEFPSTRGAPVTIRFDKRTDKLVRIVGEFHSIDIDLSEESAS